MKKLLYTLCAGVLALALVGCGGGSGDSGTSESGGTGEAVVEEKVDPAQKFVGEWKMAGAETEGVQITGDLSMFFDEGGIALTLAEDKTGQLSLGDESAKLTWELTDDTTITVTVEPEADADEESEDSDIPKTVTVAYDSEYEALKMQMEDDDFSGSIILTADGTYAGIPTVDIENAAAVTSADQVVGEWKLCGVNMFGMQMYGEPDALAENMGVGDETNLSIADDGTATMGGESVAVTYSDDGATLGDGDTNVGAIKLSGDLLVLDESGVLGMELYLIYQR